MGYWKNAQIEWGERGYGPVEGAVCPTHVRDAWLAARVREAGNDPCSYCPSEGAVPFEFLMDHVMGPIRHYYHPALDHLAWDEMPDAPDGQEVFWDIAGDDFDEDVTADIVTALEYGDRRWTPYEYSDPTSGWLGAGWQRFRHWVMHKSRFLLEPPTDKDFEFGESPQNMLDTIGDLLLQEGLVRTLDAGTPIFRARSVPDPSAIELVHEISAPPRANAPAGRMNSRRIPAFYGALDAETAAVEVYGPHRLAVVAEFVTLQALEVVDLTALPPLPSIYDVDQLSRRDRLMFLAAFAEDTARPIDRDGDEEFEYLPSQAVTEYLKLALPRRFETPVHGVLFRSSRIHPRGPAYPTGPATDGVNVTIFCGAHGALSDGQLPIAADGTAEWRSEPQVLALRPDGASVMHYGPPEVRPGHRLELRNSGTTDVS